MAFIKEEIQDTCQSMYNDSVLVESLTQDGFELGDNLILRDFVSTKADAVLDAVCCSRQPESTSRRNISFTQTSFLSPSSSHQELRRSIRSLLAERGFSGAEGGTLAGLCCTKDVETSQNFSGQNRAGASTTEQASVMGEKQPVGSRQEAIQKLETLIAPVVEDVGGAAREQKSSEESKKKQSPLGEQSAVKETALTHKANRRRKLPKCTPHLVTPSEEHAQVTVAVNDSAKDTPKTGPKSTEQPAAPSGSSESEDEDRALEYNTRHFKKCTQKCQRRAVQRVERASQAKKAKTRSQSTVHTCLDNKTL